MDDLPFINKIVPTHTAKLSQGGSMGRNCPAGEFESVEEDVGLITGKCHYCSQYFVFNFKKKYWQPEEAFEQELRDHPPKLQ
jgi:hypothetical protein